MYPEISSVPNIKTNNNINHIKIQTDNHHNKNIHFQINIHININNIPHNLIIKQHYNSKNNKI
jgi:hypothetical protein